MLRIIVILLIILVAVYLIWQKSNFALKYVVRDLLAKEAPLETVENLDLKKYLGTWYSIYEFPAWFQRGCALTKAEYVLKEGGLISVENSCEVNGKIKTVQALAWPIHEGDNSRLYVMFTKPFKGKYFIMAIDEGYQTAMVGTPDRNYLWFLSRQKSMDLERVDRFKEKARQLGFDVSRLTKVDQKVSE